MFNPKPLVISILIGLAAFTGATIAMANDVCACDGPKNPPPEPPKPEPEPEKPAKADGADLVCPTGTTEAVAKKSVEPLNLGDLVTKNGGGQITKKGGNWKVEKVITQRHVCVAKVKATKTKAVAKAPADDRPDCNPEPGMVCADAVYTGKYSRKAD